MDCYKHQPVSPLHASQYVSHNKRSGAFSQRPSKASCLGLCIRLCVSGRQVTCIPARLKLILQDQTTERHTQHHSKIRGISSDKAAQDLTPGTARASQEEPPQLASPRPMFRPAFHISTNSLRKAATSQDLQKTARRTANIRSERAFAVG